MTQFKNVDEMRQEWESREEWSLRKAFILRHWDEIPQARLACLSQVFVNMEFLGCKYNEELTEEVNELAQGLSESRREERQAVVSKIFGDTKAARVSYQGKKSTKTGSDLAKASNVIDGSKSAAVVKNPFAPPPNKRAKAEADVADLSKSAEVVRLEAALTNVRAQIAVADTIPRDKSIQFFNHVCNRSKVSWESEFVNVGETRSELYLAVNGVLITRIACPMGVDRNEAKAFAAELTLQSLESKLLSVRKESPDHEKLKNKWRFALYTMDDMRLEAKGPDFALFSYFESKFTRLKQALGNDGSRLEEVAKSLGIDVKINSTKGTGWKIKSNLVLLGSVSVAWGTFQANKEAQSKAELLKLAAATLSNTHLKVWEADSGELYLLGAMTPINHENIAKHIPKDLQGHDDTQHASTSSACWDRLILYASEMDQTPLGILTRSYQMSKVAPFEFDFTEKKCTIIWEGKTIGSAIGPNKKEAKKNAAEAALDFLRTKCFTLLTKDKIDPSSSEISFTDLGGAARKSEVIPETNLGNQMMKKMGWLGGGMGKTEQGIKEPISVVQVLGRSGLGLGTEIGITKQFVQAVTAVLQEYAHSSSNSDLVFSSEFSNDQRKKIHSIARRLQLKSVSYGSGEDRQLTVQRKRSIREVVEYIASIGGENAKYKIIPPQND